MAWTPLESRILSTVISFCAADGLGPPMVVSSTLPHFFPFWYEPDGLLCRTNPILQAIMLHGMALQVHVHRSVKKKRLWGRGKQNEMWSFEACCRHTQLVHPLHCFTLVHWLHPPLVHSFCSGRSSKQWFFTTKRKGKLTIVNFFRFCLETTLYLVFLLWLQELLPHLHAIHFSA